MTEVTCPRCGSACRPYGRKYDPIGKFPLRYQCIDCHAVTTEKGALIANQLDWKKVAALKRMLMLGCSHRAIESALGIGKATVVRYAKFWKAEHDCACGKKSGHRGWCAVRLQYSPVRSEWLKQHWHARSDSELQSLCMEAMKRATAQGHTLGPFFWLSSGSSRGLAKALCTICEKSVTIESRDPLAQLHPGRVWPRITGTAFRDECLTPEQKAQISAKKREKREWQKAKRVVKTLRAHLRASRSRTKASTQEATFSA